MPLLALFTFLLSLFAATLAHGQSPLSFRPDSAQTNTVEASPAAPALFRDGLFGSLRLWWQSSRGQRARHGSRPAFHLQLGHRFSISITKH